MNKFQVKPAVYYGTGALKILNELEYQKVLVITDPFMAESGNIQPVLDEIRKGANVTIFSDIHPDPDTALVAQGMECFAGADPDLVVACGGGSTIDAAKSILYCSRQIMGADRKRWFAAIPTTSGTGSEVTNFSVITVDDRKVPVVDDALLPDLAILDGLLTKTVPPSVTADTGMDVLTHALEAYVSTDAGSFSDALAEKAVELVFEYLPEAVRNGNDMEARAFMHDASCMAGMAFTNASLGICHSLAHAVGGSMHLPHGRANAIILPEIIDYNSVDERARRKYAKLAWRLGLAKSGDETGAQVLKSAVEALKDLINVPASFREAGLNREEFQEKLDRMADAALHDNCTRTNPVEPSLEDLKMLYNKCFTGAE